MTVVVDQPAPDELVRWLETEVAEVAGVLNAAHGRLVQLTAELIETEAWRGWGTRSIEHWLVWQAALSPHHARQVASIARRRDELPETCASLGRGELSVDQAAEVARYLPAHNDAEGASLARRLTVPQLRNSLSKYQFAEETRGDEAEETQSADRPADADAARGTTAIFTDGRRFGMRVDAPIDDGALIEKALAEAKDALFQAGQPLVTWMDALVEVCNRSLSTVTSDARTSRFRIYLHLDTEGGWLNQGPAVPPAIRDKLCCDGVVRPLWETQGAPVNVGRALRIVPDRTRRLVLDRDRGCVVPGCASRCHLEVHHLIAWSRGGRTDTDNLAALCTFHHDALHRGELTIQGDADDPTSLEFGDQRGRPMQRSRPRRPPVLEWGRPPTTEPRYRHPSGERVDNQCVFFTPRSWLSPEDSADRRARAHAPPA